MSTLTTHTTANRDAHSVGLCKFNTTSKAIEVSDGTNWSIYDYDSGTVSSVTNTLSVDFDGTTDYINFGNNSALMPTAFTISVWMKQDSIVKNTIVQKRNGSNGYQIYFDNGTFQYSDGSQTITFATGIYTSTTDWYHVAVTHTGSTVTGYINGTAISSDSSSIVSNTADLTLGRHYAGTLYSHDGKIDEFSLHNSALDAANIAQIYNGGSPIDLTVNQGNYTGSSSLVGYWRLGDGTGDTDNGSGSPATGDIVGTIVNQAAAHSDGTVGGGSPEYINDVVDYNSATVLPVTNTLSAVFDGATDKLDCGTTTSLMPTGGLTLSAWIKQDNANIHTLIQRQTVSTNGYAMRISSGVLQFYGTSGGHNFGSGFTSTTDWYHLCVTHDGSTTLKGYVNGVLQGTITTTGLVTNSVSTKLGWHSNHAPSYLQGKLDECAIFSSALDAANVTQIYNSGSPIDLMTDQGNYNSSSDLIGYWRMGDGASDTSSGGGSPASGDVIGTVVNLAGSYGNATVTGGSPEYINDAP